MAAFLDTSAILPFLLATDQHHASVKAAFRRLLRTPRSLITTSYVLLECTAILQRRIGFGPLHDITNLLMPVLRVIWVDADLHARGLRRLFGENRRALSLVDCVSFEVMDAEGIREALALNTDFADAGFKTIP